MIKLLRNQNIQSDDNRNVELGKREIFLWNFDEFYKLNLYKSKNNSREKWSFH